MRNMLVVFQYVKDTIWKQITTGERWVKRFASCFSIRQRYNLKANHNYCPTWARSIWVVFQYVKDTIWKQITTAWLRDAFWYEDASTLKDSTRMPAASKLSKPRCKLFSCLKLADISPLRFSRCTGAPVQIKETLGW